MSAIKSKIFWVVFWVVFWVFCSVLVLPYPLIFSILILAVHMELRNYDFFGVFFITWKNF